MATNTITIPIKTGQKIGGVVILDWKECLVFWIDYKFRIKFIFLSENNVLFLDIGTHNIYK